MIGVPKDFSSFLIRVWVSIRKPNSIHVPYLPKAFIYILLIPIFYYLINSQITASVYIDSWITYITIIGLAISFGTKDIKPFLYNNNGSWKKTFLRALVLMALSLSFKILGAISIGNLDDPQGITYLVYETDSVIRLFTLLPFVAIGEEFFKLLTFLGIIAFVRGPWIFRVLMATFLASLVFGYAHVFNYVPSAFIPIAFGAIPSFILLIYWKSIMPLIIEHFLFDGLSVLMKWESLIPILDSAEYWFNQISFGINYLYIGFMVLAGIALIIIRLKSYFTKRR